MTPDPEEERREFEMQKKLEVARAVLKMKPGQMMGLASDSLARPANFNPALRTPPPRTKRGQPE